MSFKVDRFDVLSSIFTFALSTPLRKSFAAIIRALKMPAVPENSQFCLPSGPSNFALPIPVNFWQISDACNSKNSKRVYNKCTPSSVCSTYPHQNPRPRRHMMYYFCPHPRSQSVYSAITSLPIPPSPLI